MAKALSILSVVSLALASLASILSPSLQAFWAAHSNASALVLAVVGIINAFLPQPHK